MKEVDLIADTNVVSYLFRNDHRGFEYRYLISGQAVGITALSMEELHFGAASNSWGDQRRRHLIEFLEEFTLVPMHTDVAEICGHLRACRDRIGRPIELADAWIAATALCYEIPVVTHDRDLEGIPGLEVLTLLDGWEAREPRRFYGEYIAA